MSSSSARLSSATISANIIGKSDRMLFRARSGLSSGAVALHRADSRRKRHRQGTHRQGDSFRLAARADKAFVPINTGSIPVDLLKSRFGHVKGAFIKGEAPKKEASFEVADQGHNFFDEIATISAETQAKLLRVIQEREFMRLGGTETIKVDVRIIAASNVQLINLVREGRFREDLYHRLNVIAIPLPPLRERKEDVPMLLDHFLRRFCEENGRQLTSLLTPDALEAVSGLA